MGEGILPEFDIVACCLPDTDETRGLFGKERFAKMKPGAFFINAGRGPLVDQMALYDALISGHVRGASLDVTTPEPPPSDHPLWNLENCQITPHVAGGFRLEETKSRIVNITAENLKALLEGKPIRNIVN